MGDRAKRTEAFAVDLSRDDSTVTATLSGELDLATRHILADALARVEPGARLVLDLRELSFVDSSGVRLFMDLDLRSRDEGWTFVIVSVPGVVQRVLEVCSIPDRVLVVDDPEAAW